MSISDTITSFHKLFVSFKTESHIYIIEHVANIMMGFGTNYYSMMGSNQFLTHRLGQLGNQWHQLHYLVRFVRQCKEVGTSPYCREHLVNLDQ